MKFLQLFRQPAVPPSRKSKPEVQEFVYRGELGNKSAPMKVKKKVHFEQTALIQSDQNSGMESQKDGDQEKPGMQVKIVMRKEEAVRMLSKCKHGGILELKDVANELKQSRQ